MNILIIEDEALVARDIQNLLRKIEPAATIVATIASVDATKKWLSQHGCPDLILSDIQLSDGVSFEVFENMSVNCPIIFTTAYDQYAIRAFKVSGIDYLLKPIDPIELAKAFEKFRNMGVKTTDEDVRGLIQQWGKHQYKERFLVSHGSALVPVNQSEVALFQKEQLIFLYNMQNEKFICDFHALDDLETLLDPKIFFRVNRQNIIHIQSVLKVKTSEKGLRVYLKPPVGLDLDISREKAVAFKKWLS
jgi:two-component system, LytTR family, response regulator